MKARIKKTGEIIDVMKNKHGVYIDREHRGWSAESLEFEVELLQDKTEDDHWQDVRERAAIAAMQGLISNRVYADYMARKSKEDGFKFSDAVSEDAIEMADALVEQLKKKEQ